MAAVEVLDTLIVDDGHEFKYIVVLGHNELGKYEFYIDRDMTVAEWRKSGMHENPHRGDSLELLPYLLYQYVLNISFRDVLRKEIERRIDRLERELEEQRALLTTV